MLEFIPDTVSKVARYYMRQGQKMPMIFVKLYMYQLFRSLAYIHTLGICHRDIKPQNLLVNPMTGVLKLCDFGRYFPGFAAFIFTLFLTFSFLLSSVQSILFAVR